MPEAVAVPDTGEVPVYDGGVTVFTPEGQRAASRPIPFARPAGSGIAVDAAGRLYAVSAQDHRVNIVDRQGQVVASVGHGRGDGPGELFDPVALAVDAVGRIYVADRTHGRPRLLGFAPDGQLLGSWTAGDDGRRLRAPAALAVDAQGRIFVLDRGRTEVVMITSQVPP
jgi:sugar lactone lactonase YvrE